MLPLGFVLTGVVIWWRRRKAGLKPEAMRSWISLGVLFACVLALGAWVYYKPATRDAETHALSTLKSGEE